VDIYVKENKKATTPPCAEILAKQGFGEYAAENP
jgi:hypothetical protein